jgi:transforming growth factor-beta-induced protein
MALMTISSLVLVLFAFVLSPCEGVNWRLGRSSSISGRLAVDPQLTNFTYLLEQTGWIDGFSCVWPIWCQEYTIFAPTDAAFTEISLEALVSNRDDLILFLENHIVEGSFWSSDIIDGSDVKTRGGASLLFNVDTDGSILINEVCQILSSDIDANNGVVFVVDRVLSTPELTAPNTVWSTLLKTPDLSTFRAALELIGMKPFLEQPYDVTLFAPTNLVFDQLGDDVFENLFDDTDALTEIILYHVLLKSVAFDDLEDTPLTTVQGEDISVEFIYDWIFFLSGVTLNGVADIDFWSRNIRGSAPGAIYIIDALLIPDSFKAYTATRTNNSNPLN